LKKILILVLVIIIILILGIGFFLVSLDPNQYKNEFEERFGNALGYPVFLGGISWGWSGGPSLEVTDVKVLGDGEDQVLLGIRKAQASLELAPLLKKKFHLTALTFLEPRLQVIKEADGRVRVRGVALGGAGKAESGASRAFAVTISKIKIENAQIGFIDRSGERPVMITIRDTDVLIRNLFAETPASFKAKMALLGNQQNVLLQKNQTPRDTKEEKSKLRVSAIGPHSVVPIVVQITDLIFGG